MARGWESKSVESQIEEAGGKTTSDSGRQPTEVDKQIRREREVLLLARARVLQQIEASSNERYKESRRRALEELENKINSIG
jgi:hypothetical protein